MKRGLLGAIVLSAVVAASGTATAVAAPDCRGELLRTTVVDRISVGEIGDYLRKAGLDAGRARFGVVAEWIEYRTVTPDNRPTTASGLVVRPDGAGAPMDLVSWEHGTMLYRGYAASVNAGDADRAYAALFASAGYLTSAPDYLGLGTGPGAHPYMDVGSETTASLDALRAARSLPGVKVTGRVLVSGFSQGGPAAMGLGRALSHGADPRLRLAALAPISGPYDLSGTVSRALDGGVDNAPAYVTYLTVAWNRLHHLYNSPAEVFLDPSIPDLFDGNHPDAEVFPKLPRTIGELLTPEFINRGKNPSGELRRALREADGTCDWRPNVPVHLFAASGDHTVSIANSTTCAQQLRVNHATVDLTDVGAVDHLPSAKSALPQVLALFQAA